MFAAGRLRIAPNICYETVLSHVIRDQINALKAGGQPPNVLVNLTNDGWFWGSSELDMHLACGVFRAVECRMPLVDRGQHGLFGLDRRRRTHRAARENAASRHACWPRSAWTSGPVGTWPMATGWPAFAWRPAWRWRPWACGRKKSLELRAST